MLLPIFTSSFLTARVGKSAAAAGPSTTGEQMNARPRRLSTASSSFGSSLPCFLMVLQTLLNVRSTLICFFPSSAHRRRSRRGRRVLIHWILPRSATRVSRKTQRLLDQASVSHRFHTISLQAKSRKPRHTCPSAPQGTRHPTPCKGLKPSPICALRDTYSGFSTRADCARRARQHPPVTLRLEKPGTKYPFRRRRQKGWDVGRSRF